MGWWGAASLHPPMWAGTHPSSCEPSIVCLLCVRSVTSPPANLVCRCMLPQVPAIVMLTRCNERGVTKCHPYYPEQAEEVMEVAPYQIEVGTYREPHSHGWAAAGAAVTTVQSQQPTAS